MGGKIYTKKGDKGTTGTFRGRMSKADQLTGVLGTIDELNSWIGVCRELIFNFQFSIFNKSNNSKIFKKQIEQELRKIQKNLMIIASGLAGSGIKFSGYETTRLEKMIDTLTDDLPELSNFIYPTGIGGAAELQMARAISRRVEREVVSYQLSVDSLKNKQILKYLNRLSDALFTMARWVNFQAGGKEEVWMN